MVEANFLQIPEGKVEQVATLIDENEDQLAEFIREQLEIIRNQQPLLHQYLASGSRPDVVRTIPFTIGAVATYLMIGDDLKNEKLELDHFLTTNATIEDQASTEEEKGENFKWFYEKLIVNCPEFTDYLADAVFTLADPEDQGYFCLGSFFVAIPFYMREEAKSLARKFGLE